MADQTITLPVTGMTCTNCALNIERGLKKLVGVQNVNVDFATERVSFEYVPAVITLEGIIDA
jgi:Cu+-exporting ATPase